MTALRPSDHPVPLGGSGLVSAPLAWGMWRLAGDSPNVARACIDAALEAGITLFDTADIYGNSTPPGFGSAEALFGRALAANPVLRDRMVIATKGGIRPGTPYNSSASYLMEAVDSSLSRLGIDVIDLYQIHRRDFLTHPHEVAAALTQMVEAGKVRAIGLSNHSVAEFGTLQSFLSLPIIATQLEFSALHSEPLFDGRIDHAMRDGIATLAWSPLGGGRLSDPGNVAGSLLAEHGHAYGVDGSTAALAWVMAHPARIIPILGSQNPTRIAAVKKVYDIEWTREQWYAVLEAGMEMRLP